MKKILLISILVVLAVGGYLWYDSKVRETRAQNAQLMRSFDSYYDSAKARSEGKRLAGYTTADGKVELDPDGTWTAKWTTTDGIIHTTYHFEEAAGAQEYVAKKLGVSCESLEWSKVTEKRE